MTPLPAVPPITVGIVLGLCLAGAPGIWAREAKPPAERVYSLTAEEIGRTYQAAVDKKVLVPTYDPFLDLLGVLVMEQKEIEKMVKKMEQPTMFTEFLNGFENIRLTRAKEIITTTRKQQIRFKIPKAFGTIIGISSGFKLHVSRQEGNNCTIVKVLSPKDVNFRLYESGLSTLKGVISMDIRQLTLYPQKNDDNGEDLIAFLDGYVPLWPFGDPAPSRPSQYRPYRIRINLSKLGTFSGSAFVKGEYLPVP
jgi:hypothetical protein